MIKAARIRPEGRLSVTDIGPTSVLAGFGVTVTVVEATPAGIVTGMNHLRGHDEQGQGFDVRLSFTDTYIKRHGHWQAWASQHTRVRP